MKNAKSNAASGDDPPDPQWLPLVDLAEMETTSEAGGYRLEDAMILGEGAGWRADAPGSDRKSVV